MKLTIAIGTYNRPEQIQRQVKTLLPQIVSKGIDLVVFDNCSKIPVSTLFSEEEIKLFKVYRNKINIGRDQNQVRCLENVNEGWVWTLSDDDIIKSNSVETILAFISKHPNSCYINFCNKRDCVATSFEELVSYFSITGTFGISFFQSACIYNIDKLKSSIFWFNDFLSSQIGQICMVLKYMEKAEDSVCVFTKESIIEEVPPGGWNPLDFIINSSIIVDKYHYKRQLLKSNLFKGMCDMYFTTLSMSNLTWSQFCYYHSYVIFKFGLFNVLRYNYLTLSGTVFKRIVPKSCFNYIKNMISKRYNRKIK